MGAVSESDSADVEALRRELAREHGRLLALRDISTAVGSTLDLSDLLDSLLERVSALLDCERATLYVLDDDNGKLWARVRGEQGQPIEISLAVGEGLAGACAAAGTLINIEDAYRDTRFSPAWDKRSGFVTRSILCVPLKNPSGRLVGVLQALNKRAGVFDSEDQALIEALGAQIAVAIENSKLFLSVVGKNMELLEAKEQLENKLRELDVLFEIANVAAVARSMDEMLRGSLAGAMRAVDAGAASVLIEGELRSQVVVRLAGEAEIRTIHVAPKDGVSGWVAEHGIPQRINDVRQHPKFAIDLAARFGFSPKTALSVPLAWEDGAGALTLFDKARGRDPFDDSDVKIATMIAGHVSTAIGLEHARVKRAQSERLSVIGQFMSGVLHDLKTPMTVIGGYVQLLADEADAGKRRRYAEAVDHQLGFLKSMMQETLAFARGEKRLWVRKVYLNQFFPELAQQLEREFEGRSVHVKLELGDRGVAHFDAAKVQRALHNLARNSAEALAKSGGNIVIRVDRRSDDGALMVRVEDDGPGISEEIAGRLFQSFATHGKSHGTGLGLAIVRSVVEEHGGTIDVVSQPGATTFTMMLPDLANAEPEASLNS